MQLLWSVLKKVVDNLKEAVADKLESDLESNRLLAEKIEAFLPRFYSDLTSLEENPKTSPKEIADNYIKDEEIKANIKELYIYAEKIFNFDTSAGIAFPDRLDSITFPDRETLDFFKELLEQFSADKIISCLGQNPEGKLESIMKSIAITTKGKKVRLASKKMILSGIQSEINAALGTDFSCRNYVQLISSVLDKLLAPLNEKIQREEEIFILKEKERLAEEKRIMLEERMEKLDSIDQVITSVKTSIEECRKAVTKQFDANDEILLLA